MDISIIIPTYNRLWSLPDAIASCKSDKYSVEIIVIDDGSTDGTADWLSKQQNIRYVIQPNLGKCWAANKGFEMAEGKYIRFLDSDDIITANANDEQMDLALSNKADVVVSGYSLFKNNKNVIKNQLWVQCDDFIAQQLGECDSSHYSAYLFRKDFIFDVPHRPDFAFRDDRLFVLEVALKNPQVAVHSGSALLHRMHTNERLQFSSGLKTDVQNFQHFNLYKFILGQLQANNQLTDRRINAAINILWPLCKWVAKSHIQDAYDIYLWILTVKPDFKVPEHGLLSKLYVTVGFKQTQRLLSLRRFIKYGWK